MVVATEDFGIKQVLSVSVEVSFYGWPGFEQYWLNPEYTVFTQNGENLKAWT
jgi:hypothetical protein